DQHTDDHANDQTDADDQADAAADADNGIQRTATQDAEVDTSGTAVADTGGNVATASTASRTASSAPVKKPSRVHATAGAAITAITQRAIAHASKDAAVDILQVAIVVNVGVAHAGSGANVVNSTAAPPGAAPGVGIQTGNATAIGQVAHTGITQSASVGRGSASTQTTAVVNVGVAVANTGLNVALGNAGAPVSGRAAPGGAIAVGNISWTAIDQRAQGTATGTALLTLEQRAIVVNFGVALANSGGNVVLSAPNGDGLAPDSPITRALWAVLAPFFQTPAVPDPRGGTGPGAPGSISTGTAVGVGNASSTNVAQSAAGRVGGDGTASARQVASVGNVGLALANTGLNGSFGNVSPNAPPNPSPGVAAMQRTTPAADTLARFLLPLTTLDWLNGPNPFTQLTASLDLQGVMLDLAGRFQGDTFGGRGVRVRQITGVVDISVAVADPPDARAAGATTGLATGVRPAGALLRTGDATALGNRATVGVCQTVNDDAGCRPRANDAEQRHPRSRPYLHRAGGVEASTVAASPHTHADVYVVTASLEVPGHAPATLPATGSDTRALLAIGLMLLGSGTLLRVSQRRLR
ncbi:MAG: hypothetical protein QOI55_1465, partial [Actinomycetota bacterium]|nr:hypothetical protein [Actinomycetota bacterium]